METDSSDFENMLKALDDERSRLVARIKQIDVACDDLKKALESLSALGPKTEPKDGNS